MNDKDIVYIWTDEAENAGSSEESMVSIFGSNLLILQELFTNFRNLERLPGHVISETAGFIYINNLLCGNVK